MLFRRRPLVLLVCIAVGLALALGQGHVAGLRAAPVGPDAHQPQAPMQGAVNACGLVIAYTPAIGILPGTLTIGLETFVINPGATISGEALLTPLNNVCITGTTNAAGRIISLTVTLAPTATPPPLPTITLTVPPIFATETPTSAAPTPTPGGPTATTPPNTATTAPATATPSGGITIIPPPATPTQTPTLTPSQTPLPGVGATIRVCGVVQAFVPATAFLPGLITIGGQTIPILPGVILDGAALLQQGANVCLDLTLNVAGGILSGTVTPNVGATVSVCGVVTAFQAATSTTPGSITIGGQTFPIAVGATLNNQNLIQVGSDLCLNAQLNANGQISTGGVTLNAGGSVSLCGTVSAFTAATTNAAGSITIGGQTIPIAAGTVLAGQNNIVLGNQYCLEGTLNASGQIGSGTLTANVVGGGSVSVCGTVSAFQAATANAPGSITIGGQTFPIAAGATLVGQEAIRLGDNFCLSGSLNAQGQIRDGAISANAGGSVSLCGRVTAFTPATANQAGSVTIGGRTIPIAAGTTLASQNLLTIGNDVCLDGQLNANGQVSVGTVTANASAGGTVQICGVVTAFQQATASAPGSVTIGGQTFPIAGGTTLTAQELLTLGNDVCLSGALNASGQINNGTVTANVGGSVSVCGTVTAFTPATASTPGSITIGGRTIPIAVGTTLVGQDQIRVGNTYCLDATLNAQGQIRDGNVTAQVGGGSNISVCGVVTAFQAATSATNGSITIGGQVIPIAAGTTLVGQDTLNIGDNYCLEGSLNVNGQINNGQISVNVTGRLCGVVDAITSSTITIDGRVIQLAPGVDIGPGVGACVAVCVELDTLGRVVRVSANVNATIQGTVNAYVPGVSITVGGQTFPIAPGANIGANIGVGSQVQLSLNGAGQVVCATGTPGSTGTPTAGPGTGTPSPGTGTPGAGGTPTATATNTPVGGGTGTPGPGTGTPGPGTGTPGPGTGTPGAGGTPTATATNTPIGGGVGTPGPGTPTATRTATPGPGDPNTGTVCVYVYDQTTGNLIVGAIVEVFDANGNLVGMGVTGTDGRVCITNIPPGETFVVARVPDCPGVLRCKSRLVRVTVVAGQTTNVDIPLECRGAELFLPHISRGATWRPSTP